MIKRLAATFTTLAILAAPGVASAHIVVTPDNVGVAKEQIFNVSVLNEEPDVPVTNVKLLIPKGIKTVTPSALAGWTITTEKASNDVTSIVWATGEIPVGQRQDFTFKAQAPSAIGEVDWKAYETYGNGKVVSWDQKPSDNNEDEGNKGPYSVTKIVDDLAANPQNHNTSTTNNSNLLPLIFSLFAVLLATYAVLFKKRN